MIPIEKFESTSNLSQKQQEALDWMKWQVYTARRFDNYVDYAIGTDKTNLFKNMTREEVEQYMKQSKEHYKNLENIWKLQRDGYAYDRTVSKSTIKALERRGLIEIANFRVPLNHGYITSWVKVLDIV